MSSTAPLILRRGLGGLILASCALLLLAGPRPLAPQLALAACSSAALLAWSLREARQGRRDDGLRTLLDSLLLGLSGAVALALLRPETGAASPLLLALALAASLSPWVGGCSRGAGALPRTLAATSGLSLLLLGGWWVAVLPETRATLAAAPVLIGVALIGRQLLSGEMEAVLVMGSPAQRRRCGRARLVATRLLPLAVVLLAAAVALQRPSAAPAPWLAGLAAVALLRARWAEPSESRAALPDPGAPARLAALGELSRLAAHEIRNSLSVLFSSTDLLRRERPAAERDELLEALSEEGERIRVVVDQLTAFASDEPAARAALRLPELARRAAGRAVERLDWPEGVTVGLEPVDEELRALGDAQRLEIAVAHVLRAAARGAARRVTIATGRGARADEVCLRIGSDGREPAPAWEGAPSRLLAEVASSDAALGLAVAQRVLREHEGELELGRAPDGGFRAVLCLPADPG